MKRHAFPVALAVVLAAFLLCAWGILAVPGTALAEKPENPGKSNAAQSDTPRFWVWVSRDPLGAFGPDGPPPDGDASTGTDGGSTTVVAGGIFDPDNPTMVINRGQTCLERGIPETDPPALQEDDNFSLLDTTLAEFLDCFPGTSNGEWFILGDGTKVRMNIVNGRSKCHDALSIGDGGDDAVFLLEFLAEITGSSSLVGGPCWRNGIRGSSIGTFSQSSMAASSML